LVLVADELNQFRVGQDHFFTGARRRSSSNQLVIVTSVPLAASAGGRISRLRQSGR
jgi:hypothetical protein